MEKTRTNVGMLTIGQSPRKDITGEIEAVLNQNIQIVENGALDGLSKKEVQQYRPDPHETALVTRLRNGQSVKVGKKKITPLMQKSINQLASTVELITVLCAGEFPTLESEKILIRPSRLTHGFVTALFSQNHIGVLFPTVDQQEMIEHHWSDVNKATLRCYQPYGEKETTLEEIGREFSAKKVDAIILDCLGYSKDIETRIRKVCDIPVLSPRTLIGRAINELFPT